MSKYWLQSISSLPALFLRRADPLTSPLRSTTPSPASITEGRFIQSLRLGGCAPGHNDRAQNTHLVRHNHTNRNPLIGSFASALHETICIQPIERTSEDTLRAGMSTI